MRKSEPDPTTTTGRAYALWNQGKTVTEIVAETGLDLSGVHKMLNRYIGPKYRLESARRKLARKAAP